MTVPAPAASTTTAPGAVDVAGPDRAARSLAGFGPSWFTTVMGTGIVAVAGATLPVRVPGLGTVALGAWLLAAAALVVVGSATAVHWRRHPGLARGWIDDPVAAHFYGAPAMALMTVGAGALLVGRPVLGSSAPVVAAVLWSAGTAIGLWTALVVPRRVTRHQPRDAAFGAWLMPVVPPMVTAATGAALVAYAPAGPPRLVLIVACYLAFALALVLSAPVIATIVGRVRRLGPGAAATVPALLIVLGPLGQSVTAVHLLGEQARGALPAYADTLVGLGVAYGWGVLALALGWLAVAGVLVARTARSGLPFSLTWWAFIFPLGTVVTGTSGLHAATGVDALAVLAIGLYAALVAAWIVVAARTLAGVRTGRLLR